MPDLDTPLLAGDLNRRCRLEAPTPAVDASPDANAEPPDGPWTVVRELWASIKPLKGDKQHTGEQLVAEATHEVRIRFYPGVRANMRLTVIDRGDHYNLVAPPLEIGYHMGWLLLCAAEEGA